MTVGDNSHSQAKPDLHMHSRVYTDSFKQALDELSTSFPDSRLMGTFPASQVNAVLRILARLFQVNAEDVFYAETKIDEKKYLDDVESKNTVKQRWTRLGSMNDLRISNIMMVFKKFSLAKRRMKNSEM